MENKNVVILKHHPRPIRYSNPFYINQCSDLEDRVIIDLTSRNPNKEFAHQVSPFYLGPVVGPDGMGTHSLEVFWQVGKVFPHHDEGGQPNEEYFTYRKKMYNAAPGQIAKPVMRHPYREFGYEADDMVYWPFWSEEKGEYEPLSYLAARKRVYVPAYAKLVANTPAFAQLKQLLAQGKKLALLDFDGFNYYNPEFMKVRWRAYLLKCKKEKRPVAVTERDFTEIKDMKSAIDFPHTPVGHAFVVKALLQGDLEVVNGEVIDHIGVVA